MRTSRVSRDAARIAALTTNRRQTRSVVSSPAPKTSSSLRSRWARDVKQESPEQAAGDGDDAKSSSLSPPPDIEDVPFTPQASRKRKRGTNGSSNALLATPANTTARKSPRKLKTETSEEYELEEKLGDRTRLPKARPQPAKKFTDPDTGEVTIHPPPNWERMYDMVMDMRKRVTAPVDTMGCERAADLAVSPRDQRFQTLIALMLSSQTKDTTNYAVMQKLRKELPSPGLTLENILALTSNPARLNELIYAVGFHNNKTKYILQTAAILRDKYDGDIPDTPEGLMSLPGVGPKMAYLCMSAAWGKTEGIGVDVHVHRICNMWGWCKTKNPEDTRKELESWLPRDKWREINWLLVGFGQSICTPVGRKCGDCDLAGRGLCAGEVVDRKVKVVKREDKVVVKEEDELVNGEKEVIIKREDLRDGVN